jgi:hypothetical protein
MRELQEAVDMKNTYLAIIAIIALATAVALTPLAVQQQAFAQEELTSSTDTDNKVKEKCNLSGIGNDCHQAGKATLDVE